MNSDDPRGALVYESAVRSLEQQASTVESIRVRAGILLSAAAITTSFLAKLALGGRDSLGLWSGLAVGLLLLVFLLCLVILWPRRKWVFRFNAKKLVVNCLDVDPPVPLAKMHRDLAIQMEEWATTNSEKLRVMFRCFWGAGIFLGVEVAFWIAALVWRR